MKTQNKLVLCKRTRGSLALAALLLVLGSCSFGAEESVEPPPQVSSEVIDESAFELPPWYSLPLFTDVWEGLLVDGAPVPNAEERKELFERGAYLVRGAGACVVCHGANPNDPNSPLSGGRLIKDSLGEVPAANITPDRLTGIGAWSVDEVTTALRASIGKNKAPLSLDSHRGYRWLSDRDTKAIAIFLMVQEPVRNPIQRRELSDFEAKDWGMLSRHSEVRGYVPSLPQKATKQYGRYLAKHVSGCDSCHTPDAGLFSGENDFSGTEEEKKGNFFEAVGDLLSLAVPEEEDQEDVSREVSSVLSESGKKDYEKSSSALLGDSSNEAFAPAWMKAAKEPAGEAFPAGAPDIRGRSASGLKGWSEEDLIGYLDTGESASGTRSDPAQCPWPSYRYMTRKDKQAIARFLLSL